MMYVIRKRFGKPSQGKGAVTRQQGSRLLVVRLEGYLVLGSITLTGLVLGSITLTGLPGY